MPINLIQYPNCATCKKAKAWLLNHNIPFTERHIVESTPSAEEIKSFWKLSGLPLKKFFNTSGKKYRELELKDRLKDMSEEDQLALLASDGMLLKRPIVTDGQKITLGFKEEDFENTWK
ncbi:arsenate reductase family protein [Rummeliibacillus stabekisii]|uniref:arsenate reductase family protein n=1 Tax=Rummeliibacillus stabekisii TaxID=241244 RepID=UPI00203E2A02|nr:arsenate reductase family protein [Rummeliibacillus stabekisii]MCM3317143.1 arsenate reductase family protein [Rummeliibacillus stabekisii]